METLDEIEKNLKVELKYMRATEFISAIKSNFILHLYKMMNRSKVLDKVVH